jgi:tetratricopeptide (TPR) repeat protein
MQTIAYQSLENPEARASLEALKRTRFKPVDNMGVAYVFERLVKSPMSHCKEVYVVLDGLDEADNAMDEVDGRRPRIEILLRCFASLPRCRLIVLSRPSVSRVTIPPAVQKVVGHKDNEKDIRLYVETAVNKLPRVQTYFHSREQNAVDYLVKKAHGIFLWVVLVLKQLEVSSTGPRKAFERDVNDLLIASGNSELDERFTIALSRVNPDYESWVKAALSFLTVGFQEFEIEELQAALETALDDDDDNFQRFLEVECGSFVQLLPDFRGGTVVQLIHETFASFLTDSIRYPDGKYFVDKPTAHAEMAALCLDVMIEYDETHIFFPYASTFWADHLRNSSGSSKGESTSKLLKSLYNFFTKRGVNTWVKGRLVKLPNLRGFEISIEEDSLTEVEDWLKSMFTVRPEPEIQHTSIIDHDPITLLSNKKLLGEVIGLASVHVWLNVDLPEFNQTANSFCLALKYYLRRETAHQDDVDSLISTEFRDILEWANEKTFPSKKNLGVAYYTLGKWDECIKCLTSNNDGNDFVKSRYLGEAYSKQGNYTEAVKNFAEATEGNPYDSMSWIGLGEAYKSKGDFDGAILALKRGIELNPSDPWFWKALAEAHMAKNDCKSAIRMFERAKEVDPNDSRIWLDLGEAMKSDGDTQGAINVLKAAVERFPTISRLWKGLYKAYEAKGDLAESNRIYSEAVHRFPSLQQRPPTSPPAYPPAPHPWFAYSQPYPAAVPLYSAQQSPQTQPPWYPPFSLQHGPPQYPQYSQPFPYPTPQPYNSAQPRTVWLFYTRDRSSTPPTSPVKRRWSALPPSPFKPTPTNDWTILISPYSRSELEARIRAVHSHRSEEQWGDLHELLDYSGTTEYQSRRYLASEFNRSIEFLFQGETDMINADLATLGMSNLTIN